MKKLMLRHTLGLFFTLSLCTCAQAKGRQPDSSDRDRYPDYNKLEFRRNPGDTPKEVDPAAKVTVPTTRPAAGADMATPGALDEDKPLPPPKPVYLSDDASEPPLPDAMKDTLIQGTTNQ